MSARSFIDTNVLVYTDASDEPEKQVKALDLVASLRTEGRGVVSLQVLQEYFVAATRKLGVDPAIARRKVELFSRFQLVVPMVDDVMAAIDLTRLEPISFWDALIVRAAERGRCRVLLSEDLAAGTSLQGVEVVNPFE